MNGTEKKDCERCGRERAEGPGAFTCNLCGRDVCEKCFDPRFEACFDCTQRHPEFLEAWLIGRPVTDKAAEEINRGFYDAAVALLGPLLTQYPENYHAKWLLGVAHFEHGAYDDASRLFREANAGLPENDDIRAWLAAAMADRGDRDDAAALFAKVLRRRPDHRLALRSGAANALSRNDGRTAVAFMERFVTLEPQDIRGWVTLANGYIKINAYALAMLAFNKLFTLEPAAPGEDAGEITEQWAEAANYLAMVANADNQAMMWAYAAVAHYRAGDDRDARAALARATELGPNDASVSAARAFLKKGPRAVGGAPAAKE